MDPGIAPTWGVDWAWGLPLILLTVVLHAYFLGLLNKEVSLKLSVTRRLRHFTYKAQWLSAEACPLQPEMSFTLRMSEVAALDFRFPAE